MKCTPTQAIVCHDPVEGKRQWVLEPISIGEPDDFEAVVEIVASGICHTDLGCGTAPDGTPGFPVPKYPRVLGHEGAGYIRAVGKKVTKVIPGDAVLLSFAFCTKCHNCQFGAPGYCHKFTELNFIGNNSAFPGSKAEPAQQIGGSFFGQSSFAQLTRAQETSIVKVTHLIKNREELGMFAPLGCGIQTGAGTITELAQAGPNDKVAIIGLGGVGLSAIMTGKQLMGSMEGGVYPEQYIPKMISWYKNSKFPVDRLIKFYPVKDYLKAIRDMEDGTTIKPILLW
ncbi:hypothetical protein SCUCBS95973_004137 [Sporothrix curviconia]|uniref:Alcohol dehydrogenase-like N-terminal domain-containing protein n=1 Tax=Sporothrix curviconia TaxID=1260050 RepID=A0ABP0BL83_9PEZI